MDRASGAQDIIHLYYGRRLLSATETMYPTCADYTNTGLWLHLLPATPTGKTACGRAAADWLPREAIDATATEVARQEVFMPHEIYSDHITVLLCGHCAAIQRRAPGRIATR